MGAATDVASAILKDPSLAERITVVAMAFNNWPAGGDVFNVVNDPLAWQVVLNSDVPLVVGSFAVTRQALSLTRSEAEELMSSRGAVGDYLHSLFTEWLDQQAPLVAQVVAPDTWVIWDESSWHTSSAWPKETKCRARGCSRTFRFPMKTRSVE